ncbi:FMN-binding protein [Dactylosporangium matsuzakiense]|uniref:FMN-binding protein n=1 Tax=Dactylosporangium matsuzakiense TaxID=53360 RepID=A0A9W6KWA4_9ACTN|nr:FMN-binding protein [Dactylosporangium matsuzakiense]UWZ41337.1 FMN-binding protein [Dactylosporangium matsuzakiense]GLL07879.1 FMN-binding protein [Dactylosporangium matsuzakiense]
MRRITIWLLSTLAGLVLLFSYRTSLGAGSPATATAAGAGGGTTGNGATAGGNSSGGGTTGGNSSGSAGSTGSGANSGATAGGTTYQGSVAATRWGDVQVTITVADGKITAVNVPVYPNGNGRDRQINARALPILTQETLTAQSARIDTVSGATVTSDGYIESLQAALDAAHLS